MNRHRRISLIIFGVLLAIIGLLFLHSRMIASPKGCLKADVIVLIDISGSVKGHEDQINLALIGFVDHLNISDEGIHAGIIAFSDNTKTLCRLTGNHDEFDDSFKQVQSDNGNTNMMMGVNAVIDELEKRGRPDAIKVVIIISDGATEFQGGTVRSLERLTLMQGMVCSVLIKNGLSDEDFMKRIGGNCYLETDYGRLYKELEKLDFCL